MSQTPHKPMQKMCKSPKSYQVIKQEPMKIDYETLSTNCTVVGSNNLNLVKKPQIVTSVSPAYSNPSPGYPPSPYSSPASLKSPSPSLKPPTPQPNFPVMQIIHNNLLARPIQTSQSQNIIKLKPHLNILPKPAASPQPSPKPSVSPQIVIPASHQQTTIMPTAQPLLLNQMPMLTAPGVQFILRPQTATKIQPQVQTATATHQGLILQPGGQQLLQLQPPRSQPMVRVLTNGMQLAPSTTTYVTQMGNQQTANVGHITQQQQQTIVNNVHHQQHHQHQTKKKPKHKAKKKLDLANIMKLSGIGDEDDIQFESDTSQSENEHTSVPTTPQPQSHQQQNTFVHADAKKNIQNIQISAMTQPTINTATPVVQEMFQVLNQNFQSGMISTNSTSQAATTPTALPFGSFITPNFTINNGGLMLQQRSSGGFKLTVGDDGRLVLQHDPTLNQDLQSQIILQNLLGLGGGLGGLVLQPSATMDQQQTVQQTVQTIQQQSVQTIQQQTVQSQTIQTVQQQTVQQQQQQQPTQTMHQHRIVQPAQPSQQQIQQQTVQQTIQHQIVQPAQPVQMVQPTQGYGLPQVVLQNQQNHILQNQQNHHHHQGHGFVTNMNVNMNMNMNVNGHQHHQNHHHHHHHAQPVLKVQPFQKAQPPVQTVQPIQQQHQPQPPAHANHQHHGQQNIENNQGQQGQGQGQNQQPPTSYVVNLTPEQLEQLKRNGQLTVNGQTLFMQRTNKETLSDKKPSPNNKQNKAVRKTSATAKVHTNLISNLNSNLHKNLAVSADNYNSDNPVKSFQDKEVSASMGVNKTLVSALNAPLKQAPLQNHVQPIQSKAAQPQATVQPQAMVQPQAKAQSKPVELARPKPTVLSPKQQKVAPTIVTHQDTNGANANPDVVDKLLGQILEETTVNNAPNAQNSTAGVNATANANTIAPNIPQQNANNNNNNTHNPQQRITTIQLTPQKQQHLKSVQLQIQTLSARLTPGDTEMQNALKLLFAEQQKILASGKLLPPDKVYYHNNQLTIVNPSGLSSSAAGGQGKGEGLVVAGQAGSNSQTPIVNSQVRAVNASVDGHATTSVVTQTVAPPRVSVVVPAGEHVATQTVHHHAHVHQQATAQPQGPLPGHVAHHNHQIHVHQSQNVTNLVQPVQGHVLGQRVVAQHVAVQQAVALPQPLPKQSQPAPPPFHSLSKKSHLIETQLNLDQNGAIKPDIHTPFRDKKDACIRLIRYHCLEQPVLSEKDLSKADEIFELTARHFIGKYAKMVDKYKYLLMKESMRQVQTSELMMLDRMFVAEEQQALIKTRQEYENELLKAQMTSSEPAVTENGPVSTSEPLPEDYDEWACIQRELGCLPQSEAASSSQKHHPQHQAHPQTVSTSTANPKRSASSDSRLETLKRFRVDKHNKKPTEVAGISGANSLGLQNFQKAGSSGSDNVLNSSFSSHEETEPENNSIDEQVQSAIDSILNLQQNTALDLDSILS